MSPKENQTSVSFGRCGNPDNQVCKELESRATLLKKKHRASEMMDRRINRGSDDMWKLFIGSIPSIVRAPSGWVTQRGKRPPQPAKKVALTPPFLSHSRKISRVALTDNRGLTGNPETWADRPTVGFNTPVISKKVWAQVCILPPGQHTQLFPPESPSDVPLSGDVNSYLKLVGHGQVNKPHRAKGTDAERKLTMAPALPRDQKPKTVSCFRYCHLCKSSLHLSPAEALTYQLSGEDDKKTGTTLEVLPAIRSLPPALQEHSDVPKTPRQHKDTVTQHAVGPIPWTQGDSDRPTFYLLKNQLIQWDSSQVTVIKQPNHTSYGNEAPPIQSERFLECKAEEQPTWTFMS
ncbi:hypothetical protein MJG53_015856 [Ovis ammon polii x Ovis aries]|uniref:Uncharacterized protein n=1 Tax=Ovis ammon polii x Ovis aries TaxID=2918886 RepID=A0ACB9UC70_9CETA|nr:hypothetical protein MJG53_015856 [Ovis ammon polii x Ovis aries]